MRTSDWPAATTEEILKYLRYLLVALHCTQWSVMLAEECVPHEATAEEMGTYAIVHTSSDVNTAVLQVCDAWETISDVQRRQTLVHEVLHLVVKDLDRRANFWAHTLADDSIRTSVLMDIGNSVERTTEALALILAPHLMQYGDGIGSYPEATARREADW